MRTRKIYRKDILIKNLGGKKYLCTTDIKFGEHYYTDKSYPIQNIYGVNGDWAKGFKIISEIDVWKCTDSDTKQYGRQVSDILFEFKEERNGETYQSGIDISGYTDDEIEDVISSYGYTLKDGNNSVFEMYGVEANWIIAECMFEMQN